MPKKFGDDNLWIFYKSLKHELENAYQWDK